MACAVTKFSFLERGSTVIATLKITTQVVGFVVQTIAILLAVGFMAMVPWILN